MPPFSEEERWVAEHGLKVREIELKERDQKLREDELRLKQEEQAQSKWRSPIVVAVLAAGLAGIGNAAVAIVNGMQQRSQAEQKSRDDVELERIKSEYGRVLEVLRTADPEGSQARLRFLLESGLVTESRLVTNLSVYLLRRQPDASPSLPATNRSAGRDFIGDKLAFKSPLNLRPLYDTSKIVCLSPGAQMTVRSTVGVGSETLLVVRLATGAKDCNGENIDVSNSYLLPLNIVEPASVKNKALD